MTKNLMPIIAKELGVELGEEFEIKGIALYKYRINNDKLEVKVWGGKWELSTLSVSLLGNIEIIRLPFNPKVNDVYWTYALDNFEPVSVVWLNHATDYTRKVAGTVFRTKEEAITARPAKYQKLTGKEWKE